MSAAFSRPTRGNSYCHRIPMRLHHKLCDICITKLIQIHETCIHMVTKCDKHASEKNQNMSCSWPCGRVCCAPSWSTAGTIARRAWKNTCTILNTWTPANTLTSATAHMGHTALMPPGPTHPRSDFVSLNATRCEKMRGKGTLLSSAFYLPS